MAHHAGSLCAPLVAPTGVASVALCSLISQAAHSVDAQNQLGSVLACMIHANRVVYDRVVLDPIFCFGW